MNIEECKIVEKHKEDIEDLIELNHEQSKAFKRLQRAVRDCRKLNVYFYQNLETIYGLNGDNVKSIVGAEETDFEDSGVRNIGNYLMPEVRTTDSFADDQHHVLFNDD